MNGMTLIFIATGSNTCSYRLLKSIKSKTAWSCRFGPRKRYYTLGLVFLRTHVLLNHECDDPVGGQVMGNAAHRS
jgi:hypothetical protein